VKVFNFLALCLWWTGTSHGCWLSSIDSSNLDC
jgi:hypothetical protein